MPDSTSLAYRSLVSAATAVLPVAARFSDKLARGHAGRAGALDRLVRWGTASRDRNRPLVWLHAASVGEGLQAAAVLERLRTRHPDWQYLYTHFSPSAESLAHRLPVDAADFLPYDRPATAESLLDTIAPSALVFVKLDLWPELATRAATRGVPVGLVAGTVSPVSGRTRWPARALQRPGYAVLSAAGAIAGDDAHRLERLGVRPDRITVLGDPRFDSVAEVVAATAPDDPLLSWGRNATAMIAGSTWPLDEAVVLEAFAVVRREHPAARLVLVPHEPTDRHLDRVRATAARFGLPAPVRLSQATDPVPFLLVDRVGGLARLYGGGRMAYVGGGFGKAGLHSVLEPAAWGLPVAFGPWWSNSREAGLLLDAGAAVSLPPRSHGAGRVLAETWTRWLDDDGARSLAGRKALEVVQAGAGAADRNARLVEQLVLTTG